MMTHFLKTDSRKNDYIWSEVPYLITNYALLSKVSYPNVAIYQVPWEKVGTVYKSAHEVMFETWFPQHENQIVYDTTNEAFDALENGEIDLLMLSENMLLQQTNLRQKTGFKVNVNLNVPLDSFFGFSKNEIILRSVVDKTMTYININSIASEWMSKVFDYQSEIARVRVMYFLFIVMVMLAALVALLFFFISNKRLGKRLLENSTKLSTIYQSIPDIIFTKNTSGLFTGCNPNFEKQVGLPEHEIIGKTYAEVLGVNNKKIVEKYTEADLKILSERTVIIEESEIEFANGTRQLLETLKAPLIQNGVVTGILNMGRDVTERREIKSRLDSIINAAQIAFILVIDGIITETNQYCKDYIGMNTGDDIGKFYTIAGQWDEVLKLTRRYSTISNYVIQINTAGGNTHRFLSSVTEIVYEQQQAHIVWALDIEDDEKKSDLLRETQLSFHMVLDTLPMPIRIVDLESGRLVYVNDSMVELLEFHSKDDVCGLSINEIMPAILSDGSPSSERISIIITDSPKAVTLETEYLTRSGKIVEAVIASRIIDYQGRRSSIGIIKDLTEEKHMAQILRESAEREREANQAKSAFLANMSHEIRTPMNGIIGMTDLLLNENLAERQLQYAKDIKTSAESLLGIINDILDLSKITEGKLQITPVDVDLSALVRNTVSMMRFSAQLKGLSFIDDIQINNPEYVRIDDVRLNQIITNLLSNAIKFTSKGSVKLVIKIEDNTIYIEVVDTGIGIHEDELPKIFSAFEQADKRKNRAIKGTGLGLSITKNLVELMGGKIWVKSKYETGSTFFVTLPYIRGDESAIEITDGIFKYIYAPTAQILLVDDIQTNLTVGTGLLRLCGITADVALSGFEAIEYIKSRDYDMVFMDHMMPEMDGIEAVALIRSLGEKYRNLPIVALTANAVGESKSILLASGMDDFLSKPIDKTELMNVLQKWLPPEKIKSTAEIGSAEHMTPFSDELIAVSKAAELDIDLALNRIGGFHEVLEESIKQTAYSVDEKLKEMDNFLVNNDLHGFSIAAHGFKGALANIGATKYSELAAALEIGAKAENKQLCMEKFAVFSSVLKDFSSQMMKVFKKHVEIDKPTGSTVVLSEQIINAIDLLDSFEAAEALSCLEDLAGFTYGAEIDAALEKAIYAVGRYNYNEAVVLLKELQTL